MTDNEVHIGSNPYTNRKLWLVIIVCATLIALIYGGRSVFAVVSQGRQLDWVRQVGFEFLFWYVWAAFTPFVIWFASRFEIEKTDWRRLIPALIAFGLFISPLQATVEIAIAYTIDSLRHMPANEMALRRQLIFRGVIVESFSNFIVYFLIVGSYYAHNYYQKFRERELRSIELEGRLAQAELHNLKMQL